MLTRGCDDWRARFLYTSSREIALSREVADQDFVTCLCSASEQQKLFVARVRTIEMESGTVKKHRHDKNGSRPVTALKALTVSFNWSQFGVAEVQSILLPTQLEMTADNGA